MWVAVEGVMNLSSRLLSVSSLLLAASLAGCIPVAASMPTSTWRPGEEGATCQPGSYDDVQGSAWSPSARRAAQAKLQNGEVVVVSALGCRVDVLQRCQVDDEVRRTDLGAAIAYDLAGATVGAADLEGVCEGATHVVEAASVDERGRLGNVALAPLSLDDFDLSGAWKGTMRQPGGPYEVYDLRFEMVQTGSRVRGMSELSTADGRQWGRIAFEGRLDGNTLYFADTEVVADDVGIFLEWCMKGGYAVVDPTSRSMHGPWRAFACMPGTLELEKSSPRPAAPAAPAAAVAGDSPMAADLEPPW